MSRKTEVAGSSRETNRAALFACLQRCLTPCRSRGGVSKLTRNKTETETQQGCAKLEDIDPAYVAPLDGVAEAGSPEVVDEEAMIR